MTWQLRNFILYFNCFFSWMPHYQYLRGISRKIHKIYLMRGGKYCRLVINEFYGEQHNVWITIKDLALLNQEMNRFDYDEKHEFLTSEGQLQHEIGTQLAFFNYMGTPMNDEIIYFMKEGTVHQPEIFEQVVRGYNIDDLDFQINTEDNERWLEPHLNY